MHNQSETQVLNAQFLLDAQRAVHNELSVYDLILSSLTTPMHLSTVIVPTLHMGKLSLGGEVDSCLLNDDF